MKSKYIIIGMYMFVFFILILFFILSVLSLPALFVLYLLIGILKGVSDFFKEVPNLIGVAYLTTVAKIIEDKFKLL